MNTSFIASRLALSGSAVPNLIKSIAPKLAAVLGQKLAAQAVPVIGAVSGAALNAAFLPSIMLSGFIFQIDSMPAIIRAVTYIIPARYFVSTLQSLFLAGNIPVVLIINVLFLIASAVMFIGLTWLKTKRRLD